MAEPGLPSGLPSQRSSSNPNQAGPQSVQGSLSWLEKPCPPGAPSGWGVELSHFA